METMLGERLDGLHSQLRPVFDPVQWSDRAQALLDVSYQDEERGLYRDSVAHLSWDGLWPMFQTWFEEGL